MITNRLISNFALGGAVAIASIMPMSAQAAGVRDCDQYAVVYCGAYTQSELLTKIEKGDSKHTTADIQHIFYGEGRGITKAGIQSAKAGVVYANGDVKVDGKLVATG